MSLYGLSQRTTATAAAFRVLGGSQRLNKQAASHGDGNLAGHRSRGDLGMGRPAASRRHTDIAAELRRGRRRVCPNLTIYRRGSLDYCPDCPRKLQPSYHCGCDHRRGRHLDIPAWNGHSNIEQYHHLDHRSGAGLRRLGGCFRIVGRHVHARQTARYQRHAPQFHRMAPPQTCPERSCLDWSSDRQRRCRPCRHGHAPRRLPRYPRVPKTGDSSLSASTAGAKTSRQTYSRISQLLPTYLPPFVLVGNRA